MKAGSVADLGQSGSHSTIQESSTERYPSTTCETLKPFAARSSPDTSSATTKEKTSSRSLSRRPGSLVATTGQEEQLSLPGLGIFSVAKSPTGSEPGKAGRPGASGIESTSEPFPRSSLWKVNWNALTPENKWTLRCVAKPISDGYSEREVARMLGLPLWIVKQRLQQLREALLEQAA